MIELASTLLTASGPLITTTCVLRLLKSRPDRDLALPMPMMLLVVLGAQNRGAQGYLSALLVLTLLVVLYGCWQQKRHIARWAAIACGGLALYVQLGALGPKPSDPHVRRPRDCPALPTPVAFQSPGNAIAKAG